jgi:hypothetical protein
MNYDMIPEHCRASMKAYIERGVPLGGFLSSIVANDLVLAAQQADQHNIYRLKDYALFLHGEAPSEAWGSAKAYQSWVKRGGLNE